MTLLNITSGSCVKEKYYFNDWNHSKINNCFDSPEFAANAIFQLDADPKNREDVII